MRTSKPHKYKAKRAYRCLSCGAAAEKGGCLSCRNGKVQHFPSKAEARRYDYLRLRQQAGEIHGLELQPRFPLYVNGTLVGHLVADFQYVDNGRGVIVEDVKGGSATDTDMSKWKRKHLHAQSGITVELVRM